MRAVLIWLALGAALCLPVLLAANSPLLAWRQPVYIAGGLAGIVALTLIVLQPLLAAGWMPALQQSSGRRVHRWNGVAIVLSICVHVAALWITSPPDVVDALLFVSPTPFSHWGVMAMWALFAAALLALLRRPLRLGLKTWRIGHTLLVATAVAGSVLHAMLVDGTMEIMSKTLLCGLALGATAAAIVRLRAWRQVGR